MSWITIVLLGWIPTSLVVGSIAGRLMRRLWP